ncbi:MAG: hypothetical protein JO205_05075 [Pseudolabrys sp.]|nr:hypothetical protein [Pseudolabrys sp.]MBV9260723.1 hypothetical protein [Pseudolabrys sp.]
MHLRLLAAAFIAAAFCASVVMAQDKPDAKMPDAAKPTASEQQANDKPEPGKTYVPGIEQFMNVIQTEHTKLWFAAQAKNWDLAAYNLGEIKELLGDVQDLYPKFKSLPFADMTDAVVTGPIGELEKAVDAKDGKKFAAAYDNLVTACNGCHEGTQMGFVVIQRPTVNQFSNQNFARKKK